MILVTGATGHIGNVLVRELRARGRPVRALILPGEDCTPLAGLEVECVEGDVLDPASLKRAFSGVDVVYHLAGIISIMPGRSIHCEQVNVQGAKNVLAAARAAGIRRLVYTSSIHAIRRVPCGTLMDETLGFVDPLHAAGAYDRSKSLASQAVLQAVAEGLDAVIVCPTGVIGPFDFRRSEMGQLVLSGLRQGIQFCVQGAYDFVDVRDVALGEILACEKGRPGEIYILSGHQILIKDFIIQVRARAHNRGPVVNLPLWLARFGAAFTPWYCRLTGSRPQFTAYSLDVVTGNSAVSCAKAARELGYAPRLLAVSIADTVGWWLDNRRAWARGS